MTDEEFLAFIRIWDPDAMLESLEDGEAVIHTRLAERGYIRSDDDRIVLALPPR